MMYHCWRGQPSHLKPQLCSASFTPHHLLVCHLLRLFTAFLTWSTVSRLMAQLFITCLKCKISEMWVTNQSCIHDMSITCLFSNDYLLNWNYKSVFTESCMRINVNSCESFLEMFPSILLSISFYWRKQRSSCHFHWKFALLETFNAWLQVASCGRWGWNPVRSFSSAQTGLTCKGHP